MRACAPWMRWPRRLWLALAGWLLAMPIAFAAEAPRVWQWFDRSGSATIEQVATGAGQFQPMERPRPLALGDGALWLRVDTGPLPAHRPGYLTLTGSAFINRASLFTPAADGWRQQVAGDRVPVAEWPLPHFAPLFELPPGGGTVWVRIENQPAPVSAHLRVLSSQELQDTRNWTHLLVGAYLGFGLLVAVLALMHGRLSADVAFHSYAAYVICMLLFQLAFTGLGAVFFWPRWAWLADAMPSASMLLMTAAGIWNIRNATALARHGRRIDRAALGFSWLCVALIPAYLGLNNAATYAALNILALASVALSISLCLWTWRRGETYSMWLFFGFLPVHLAYPFPALRAAGVLPDSWATQYAVLIGSAIEIPLLLYILHRRAQDFSENHARLRAIDSTDPLTGLTGVPVLRLRLRDALRRARRSGDRCSVLLVELANHGEIVASAGREAGDRALVVTGARLSQVVREVDTVCRIADTRFAILIDGPQRGDLRHRLAQHVVARGLERVPRLPPELPLRFKLVTAAAPAGAITLTPDAAADEQSLMEQLGAALDRLLRDPRRVIDHLEGPVADAVDATNDPAAAGAPHRKLG